MSRKLLVAAIVLALSVPAGGIQTATADGQGVVAEEWVARYDGPCGGDDGAEAIALDDAGNVYVTGSSEECGSTDVDYATIKYSSDGTQE